MPIAEGSSPSTIVSDGSCVGKAKNGETECKSIDSPSSLAAQIVDYAAKLPESDRKIIKKLAKLLLSARTEVNAKGSARDATDSTSSSSRPASSASSSSAPRPSASATTMYKILPGKKRKPSDKYTPAKKVVSAKIIDYVYREQVKGTDYNMVSRLNSDQIMKYRLGHFNFKKRPKIEVRDNVAFTYRELFGSYCGKRVALKNWLYYV